jgi:hypothetical protein
MRGKRLGGGSSIGRAGGRFGGARSRMARGESLTSYAISVVEFGEDFAGGAGIAGGDVVETLLELSVQALVFRKSGELAEDDLLDELFGGEALVLSLGGELGFDLGLEFEADHGVVRVADAGMGGSKG